MSNPMDWAMASQGGMQMSFATLTQEKCEELGKPGSDRLAGVWASQLTSGGVTATVYAIDPGRFLFTTDGAGLVNEVKKFALQQPDIDWFEFNQQRFYPEGRSAPLMDHE